jgi:hypothetical protein
MSLLKMRTNKKTNVEPEITVLDYSDKKMDITKLKQCDLKNILKYYNLRVSGNKSVLINRIEDHYKKNEIVVSIQKNVRGFFVRLFFKLRGNKFNRLITNNLVNGNDFYTMDPFDEIEFYNLFVYTDIKGFNYAFSIQSLISLYSKKGYIENPYNRGKFPLGMVLKVFSLYGMIKIIFGDQVDGPELKIPRKSYFTRQNYLRNYYTEPPPQPITYINDNINIVNTVNVTVSTNNSVRVYNYNNDTAQSLILRRLLLTEMKQKPMVVRVEEMFIGIDQLGNFTRSAWFKDLNNLLLRFFYENLKKVWNYKAGLLIETKRRLYPFGELFHNSDEDISLKCVNLIENLVFAAIDIEDRVLATNLILMALSTVSNECRNHYHFLYDSINW